MSRQTLADRREKGIRIAEMWAPRIDGVGRHSCRPDPRPFPLAIDVVGSAGLRLAIRKVGPGTMQTRIFY